MCLCVVVWCLLRPCKCTQEARALSRQRKLRVLHPDNYVRLVPYLWGRAIVLSVQPLGG